MEALPYTSLMTVLVVIFTFWLSANAGALRGKNKLAPPAMTGSAEYEIANRIHVNTIEVMVLLIPLTWLTAAHLGDIWGAIAGLVWLLGRVLYRQAMLTDPSTRTTGMIITIAPLFIMAIALTITIGLSLATAA